MSDTFLAVRGLRKQFDSTVVLDGVDMDVERGLVTTIIGKSGTGKSVLLKCLAGIIQADDGEILRNGETFIPGSSPACRNRLRFSYMFQNNALFDSLTAFENVALPLHEAGLLNPAEIRAKVEGLLEELDLREAMSRYPGELSGGMQKRVAFARALVTDPELVLFDEPTTGLDPERKYGIFDLIARYRAEFGFTALLVSHDIPEVFQISDRLLWLNAGRVCFSGSPEDLEAKKEQDVMDFVNKASYRPKRTI